MPVLATTPTATTTGSLIDRYVGHASDDLKSKTVLLYGPSGTGKSRRLLQLSQFYPGDEKVVQGNLVKASDIFVVSYDKGGMLSGLPVGLDVPRISVQDVCFAEGTDVTDINGNIKRKLMPIRDFHKKILFPLLTELYKSGVRVFGFDTITTMMELVGPELAEVYSKDGQLDGMKYWPALSQFANEFYLNSSSFPGVTVVYLGHSKFKEDIIVPNRQQNETLQDAKERSELKKVTIDPYLSQITLRMPGQTAEPFMDRSSLVLALELMLNPKTKKYERQFVVHPGETEHRAKNRFADWLEPKEPANLKYVLDKIEAKANNNSNNSNNG